jgi:HD-GYP domain-containing protein (c-di-GMP phosphodiesterase class II)
MIELNRPKPRPLRLITLSAAARMLQIGIVDFEKLCNAKIIKVHKVSSSLPQVNFDDIVEFRKNHAVKQVHAKQVTEQITQPSANKAPVAPQEIITPTPTQAVEFVDKKEIIDNRSFQYQSIVSGVILKRSIEEELRAEKYNTIDRNVYPVLFKTPLYCKTGNDIYTLFKKANAYISSGEEITTNLYVKHSDRKLALHEFQTELNDELKLLVENPTSEKTKTVIANLLDIIFNDSDPSIFSGLNDTIEILVTAVSKNQGIITSLLSLLELNSELIAHATRTMALVMKFCIKNNYTLDDTKILCLSALLHDIGRTLLTDRLGNATLENLTGEDAILYKSHPQIGYELLKELGIKEKAILVGILEHHERLDGSGFPAGKKKFSFIGQLLGIVDTYDDIRRKRSKNREFIPTLVVLKELKEECEKGRFSKELFECLVHSLIQRGATN